MRGLECINELAAGMGRVGRDGRDGRERVGHGKFKYIQEAETETSVASLVHAPATWAFPTKLVLF